MWKKSEEFYRIDVEFVLSVVYFFGAEDWRKKGFEFLVLF